MQDNRILKLRLAHRKTQKRIAEILQCSLSAYRRYEKGLVKVPTTIYIRMADFYGVSTDYLFGLTSNPKPHPRPDAES